MLAALGCFFLCFEGLGAALLFAGWFSFDSPTKLQTAAQDLVQEEWQCNSSKDIQVRLSKLHLTIFKC